MANKLHTIYPLNSMNYSDVIIKDEELLEKLHTIGEFYLSISVDDIFFEMR